MKKSRKEEVPIELLEELQSYPKMGKETCGS